MYYILYEPIITWYCNCIVSHLLHGFSIVPRAKSIPKTICSWKCFVSSGAISHVSGGAFLCHKSGHRPDWTAKISGTRWQLVSAQSRPNKQPMPCRAPWPPCGCMYCSELIGSSNRKLPEKWNVMHIMMGTCYPMHLNPILWLSDYLVICFLYFIPYTLCNI